MRLIFTASFGANIILAVAAMVVMPDRVASHFGSGGVPDGWMSGGAHFLIMTGVSAAVFVSFYVVSRLVRGRGARWLSIPHRDYWLQDENRPRLEAMLAEQMWLFGTVTQIFMFVVGLLVIQANLSEPVRLREDIFWWPFGLFMLATLVWTVRFFILFDPRRDRRG